MSALPVSTIYVRRSLAVSTISPPAAAARSDHGIETLRFAPVPDDAQLDAILGKRLAGETLSELEIAQFTTAVLVWLGRQYAARGWVMQLHIGAIRNNTRMFRLLGPDTGFDSIGDNISWALSRLLDSMDVTNELPKTILYCLNPRDNEVWRP